MNRIVSSIGTFALASLLLAAPSFADDKSAKEDLKDAGKESKKAAVSTGKAVKKGSKKAVNKTAEATEKGAEKVKEKTKP